MALGDALMCLADAARLMDVDPEIALNAAADRFIARFRQAEERIEADGWELEAAAPDILRKYWDSVKL